MTINYAFLWDTQEKKIVEKARGNGIELMAELPFLCAKAFTGNLEEPGRFYVTIAAHTVFKCGRVPQSSLELYAMMYQEEA